MSKAVCFDLKRTLKRGPMKTLQKISLVVAFFTFQLASAYYSVLETGQITEHYRITASPQAILTGNDGLNVSGRFDFPILEDLSGRAVLGLGEVDVFLGGSVKWVPIPDYESQPAFGVIGGVFFARDESVNFTTLRLAPIASKQFDTQIGLLTPYASLPFGMVFYKSTTASPINLTFGSELAAAGFEEVKFLLEMGFKLNKDSFTYITAGAAWEF